MTTSSQAHGAPMTRARKKSERKKPGPPKTPRHLTRHHILTVRLRPDEWRRVSQAARASEAEVSTWVRGRLLDNGEVPPEQAA